MFKDLLSGNLRLKKAFWLFSVCGLFTVTCVVYMLNRFVHMQIGNMSLLSYFIYHFRIINPNPLILTSIGAYLLSVIALVFYNITVIKGVFRCANNYKKSWILKFMAKAWTVAFVGYSFYLLRNLIV